MSPEERRSVAALARLRQEIGADRALVARCHDELLGLQAEAVLPSDRSRLVHLAALVHAYYTGIETLLERVLRQLDGDLPAGERWHESLLVQAAAEIPGVRPAILDGGLRQELDALRRFRHFFRHAYGLDLDAALVHEEASRLRDVQDPLSKALDRFDDFLRRSMEDLAGER